jgi:hypothetical protein
MWMKLSVTPVTETMKMAWYKIIHDTMLTNKRLHKIRISPTAKWNVCAAHDTLMHHLTTCGEGGRVWEYAQTLKAQILRTTPRLIPEMWLLHPQFTIWPPEMQLRDTLDHCNNDTLQNLSATEINPAGLL